MDGTSLLVGLGAGAVGGALAAWVLAQARARREAEAAAVRESEVRERAARLEEQVAAERRSLEEKVRLFQEMEQRLQERFRALSAEALRSNNEAFLSLAGTKLAGIQDTAKRDLEARQTAIDELLRPVRESLRNMDATLQGVEKEREGAYRALLQQVDAMNRSQGELRAETAQLVRALRAPQVRGRWGEIQLHRVVELAGMLDHCDFHEQASAEGPAGRLRPDLVVHLPGGKNVVVDAKTPLEGYLEALEAKDDGVREQKLADHARQVRDHMRLLSQKGYWDQFRPAPEFVVMFLPGETFFSAALQKDPALIEFGVEQRVIPASPTTLIALLRAVAYGWQQERIAEDAQRIHDLGRELHDRLRVFVEHFQRVGRGLGGAVAAYNEAAESMRSRLLVTARKLEEMGPPSQKVLPAVETLDQAPRPADAGEPAA